MSPKKSNSHHIVQRALIGSFEMCLIQLSCSEMPKMVKCRLKDNSIITLTYLRPGIQLLQKTRDENKHICITEILMQE